MEVTRVLIEPLDAGDLVAFAQCAALDATLFPHPSVPADASQVVLARSVEDDAGRPIVGFVAMRTRGDALEITGLGVARDWRRQGVGRRLLQAAIDEAVFMTARFVWLHVSTANRTAIALYESEGFARTERLPGFYSARGFADGGAAWLMMRRVA